MNPQYTPHEWSQYFYSRNPQPTPPTDTSSPLTPTDIIQIQRIVGSLLYYGREVDPIILPVVKKLETTQAAPSYTKQ